MVRKGEWPVSVDYKRERKSEFEGSLSGPDRSQYEARVSIASRAW